MGHTLIFGGTFDPVHHGHLVTAMVARELVGAERVLFLPARVSPHKVAVRTRGGASGADRLAMVERAIAGSLHFVADGRELLRGGERASYTIDTVEELRGEMAEEKWTLLMGADQLAKFHTWHRVRELLAMVGVAILGREGTVLEEGLGVVARELGEGVAERFRAGILRTPVIEISATEVRRRVGAGVGVEYLVPAGVEAYVREHRLYLSGS